MTSPVEGEVVDLTGVTDGTLIRLKYQVALFDSVTKEEVVADAGREFVAIDGIDVTERGPYVNVVEPDEYDEIELYDLTNDVLDSWLVLADVEAFEVVGPFKLA